MSVEWDPAKARTNLSKHGVRFADAVGALEDSNARTVREERTEEERWVTLGLDSQARLLVVVYTWRGEKIRMISARRATPNERLQYEAES